MPVFWNGNEGRQAGRLFVEIKLDSDNLNMLADQKRLMTFPFDRIRFEFLCVLAGEKRAETADKCIVALGPQEYKGQHVSIPVVPHAGEFDMTAFSYAHMIHTSPATGLSYEDVAWSVHLQRNGVFYIYKGILPLLAGVLFGFLSFVISPDELSARLQIQVAIFLTCFAIQWLITERLPRIPYLTILDHFVFAAVSTLCVMSFGQCVSYSVGKRSVGFWQDIHSDFALWEARLVDIATLIVVSLMQVVWAMRRRRHEG